MYWVLPHPPIIGIFYLDFTLIVVILEQDIHCVLFKRNRERREGERENILFLFSMNIVSYIQNY